MKTNFIKFVIAFVLLTSLTIVGCTKDPEYPLPVFGDPAEGIAGVWKLSTIKQSDLVIKAAVKPQIDLTDFLTKGTAVSIAFDKMAKTYQVTGSLRVNYLGSNGTFAFNDAKNPTKLLLTDISNKVYSLDLGSPIRPEYKTNNLVLSLTRTLRNKPALLYNFVFTR